MNEPTELEAIEHGSVIDGLGVVWYYDSEYGDWAQDVSGADPESWTKVSGNYGPVRLHPPSK